MVEIQLLESKESSESKDDIVVDLESLEQCYTAECTPRSTYEPRPEVSNCCVSDLIDMNPTDVGVSTAYSSKGLIHEQILKNEENYHINKQHVNLQMLGDSPPSLDDGGLESGTATSVASPLMASMSSFAYEENIRQLVLSECAEDSDGIAKISSSENFKATAGALLGDDQDGDNNALSLIHIKSRSLSSKVHKSDFSGDSLKKKHESDSSSHSNRRKMRKNTGCDPLDQYRFGRMSLEEKKSKSARISKASALASASKYPGSGSNSNFDPTFKYTRQDNSKFLASTESSTPSNAAVVAPLSSSSSSNALNTPNTQGQLSQDHIPPPSYFPDFSPNDWLNQSHSGNRPDCGILVSDFPIKSRVETQIRIALHIYPPPQELLVHLPTDTISKPKLQLKTPFIPNRNCLMLETIVVCSSNLNQYANMCRGCINRERKRASRKKVRLPVEEAHWSEGVERRVIVFNCREVMNFSDEEIITVNGKSVKSKRLELPMRLACYCRHHNEKIGFRVFFVLKNFEGKVVGRGVSNAVMITDDHKAGGALDSAAAVENHIITPSNVNNLSTLDKMNRGLDAFNSTFTSANSTDSELASVPVNFDSRDDLGQNKNKNKSTSQELNSSFSYQLSQVMKLDFSSTSGDSTSQTSPISHAISPPSLKSDPSTAASSPLLSALNNSNHSRSEQENFFIKQENDDLFDDRSSFLTTSSLMVDFDDIDDSADNSNGNTNNNRNVVAGTREEAEFPIRESITIANNASRNASMNTVRNDLLASNNMGTNLGSNNNSSGTSMLTSAANSSYSDVLTSTSTSSISSPSAATAGSYARDELLPRGFCNFDGPLPTIERVIPTSGPLRGGIEVTLLGSGFVNGLVARFGGNRSVATHCWNSTTIVAQLPPAQLAGPVQVNFEGWSSSESAVFHYYDDTDKQLVDLALQVIGLKMSGRVQDAREVAKSIIGSNRPSLMELQRQIRGDHGGARESECHSDILEDVILACLEHSAKLSSESDYTYNYDLTNREGQSMLHLASILGFGKLCAALIHSGCVVDIKDKSGFSALHFAMLNKKYDVVHLLLQNGADLFSTTFTGTKALDLCDDRYLWAEFMGQYLSMSPYTGSPYNGSPYNGSPYNGSPYGSPHISDTDSDVVTTDDLPPAYDDIYPKGCSFPVDFANSVVDMPTQSMSNYSEKIEVKIVASSTVCALSDQEARDQKAANKRQWDINSLLWFSWIPIFLALALVLFVQCADVGIFKRRMAISCRGLIGLQQEAII